MNTENLEYVGFWQRVAAYFVDSILIAIYIVSLAFVVALGLYSAGESATTPLALSLVYMCISLSVMAIVVFCWMKVGATPGKLMLHARIVDANTGAPLTLGKCIVRYLGYTLSLIPFGLGFIWVAFDSRKQGWHDKLANSVVVRSTTENKVEFSKDL